MSARREFTVLTISSHDIVVSEQDHQKGYKLIPLIQIISSLFSWPPLCACELGLIPAMFSWKPCDPSRQQVMTGPQRWWHKSGSFHVYLMNNLIKLMSGAIFKKDVSLLRDPHGIGGGDVWHFRLISRWFKRPLSYPLRPLLGKRFQALTWHNRVYIGQNLVVPKWPVSSDCGVIRTRLNVAWPYRENRFFAKKRPFRLKIFNTSTILNEFPKHVRMHFPLHWKCQKYE